MRELAALEEDIPRMETRQAQLEKEMVVAATDYVRLNTLSEEQHALEAKLATAMNRWEELASRAEQ